MSFRTDQNLYMTESEKKEAALDHLRTSHAELLAALIDLAAAFAGARPDIAHLLGPKEIAAYDKARAAISKAEGHAP